MADDSKAKERTRPKEGLELDEILRRVDSLPILDPRSPDEIVGYDENGLPTRVATGDAYLSPELLQFPTMTFLSDTLDHFSA